MFLQSITCYIALRYTRAKKRSGFVSFISLASMLGIALGVMVLITVLSVMNGFDRTIKHKFFSMAPPITVNFPLSALSNWQDYIKPIQLVAAKAKVTPFISANAMLSTHGQFSPVNLFGVLPNHLGSDLASVMQAGRVDSLTDTSFHILVGKTLAEKLNLHIGDSINVFVPQTTMTPMGVFARYRRVSVSGIFHANTGFNFDGSVIFMYLGDAKRLLNGASASAGLHVRGIDIYRASTDSQLISDQLPPTFAVSNWMQTAGAFFKAIAMEKTMMFLILLLIIMVAVFNLVSSLVMLVNDKQSDIAILRTIGAPPKMILKVFMLQGLLVGCMGTLIGVVLGVILSLTITDIANWIQHFFNIQLLSSSVYFVDYLPSHLSFIDVVQVSLLSIALSFLATIYPASVAFKVQPAEALRYE